MASSQSLDNRLEMWYPVHKAHAMSRVV